MQPRLLTIIVIIVILYIIQHTSNRMIVKENFLQDNTFLNQDIIIDLNITQYEYNEINKLCEKGINKYIKLRGEGVEHSYALEQAQMICQ